VHAPLGHIICIMPLLFGFTSQQLFNISKTVYIVTWIQSYFCATESHETHILTDYQKNMSSK